MEQYIPKAAVVAEIEKRIKVQNEDGDFNYLQIKELESLLSFLDTLEVKEVDLEEEIVRVSKNEYFDFTDWKSIARHFFELGLNARKEE